MQQLKGFQRFVSGKLTPFLGPRKSAQQDNTTATTATTPTLEKTSPASQLQTTFSADTGVIPAMPHQAYVPPGDQNEWLMRFRHATGIHNDPAFERNRIAPNRGIYPRVVAAEEKYARSFRLFQLLINAALGLQIVFAAALTALGAGKGSHVAITFFGAMNTIVAGFLTFLKGSGLPNRYKYYQNEMLKVREYVEQREREFARGDNNDLSDTEKDQNLRQEVFTIEQLYEHVCQDIEANTPDNYISLTKAAGVSTAPPTSLAKRVEGLRHTLGDRIHNVEERFESGRRGIEDRLESGMGGIDRARSALERRFTEEKQGLQRRYTEEKQGFQSRVSDMQDNYDRSRQGLQSRVNDSYQGMQDTYGQSRQGLQSRLSDEQRAMRENYAQSDQGLERSITGSRVGFESRLQDTRRDLEGRIDSTRLEVEDHIGSTRHDLEQNVATTRGGLQSQVTQVSSKVDENRREMEGRIDDVEEKAKNMEEKTLDMVEKMAGKVLAMTSKHHEEDPGGSHS